MKDYRRQLMNDLSDGIYEWAIPKDFDEGFNEVLSNLQKSNPYNQKLAEVLDCFYRRGMNQRRISDACQVGPGEVHVMLNQTAKAILKIPYYMGYLQYGYRWQFFITTYQRQSWERCGWKLPGRAEEIPIEWLGLPNRERNFLLRNQITTVAELCAYSQEDLLQLPKIGNGMLSTIVHALDTVNLSLEK